MLNLVSRFSPIQTSAPGQLLTPVLPQDEEVRLYSTPQERELFDSLSTLYSIIVSFEYLERAYVRDSVGAKE